jgi:hypothetical protein
MNKAQLEAIASGILDTLGEDPSKYDPSNLTAEQQIIQAAAQMITEDLRRSLLEKGGTATRDLLQSLEASRTIQTGDTIESKIVGAKHWEDFEYGRPKKQYPPPRVKDIEEWITAKGIPVRKSKGQSKLSVMQQRRGMAIAISRAIYNNGTIKRFGYQGSGFIKEVITPANLQVISEALAKMYGERLAIYATIDAQ